MSIKLYDKEGGDAPIKVYGRIEGSWAPRDIVKALNKMGNLAQVTNREE